MEEKKLDAAGISPTASVPSPKGRGEEFGVEAKLGTLEWKKSPKAHIALWNETPQSPCATVCVDKPCTTVCPAKVYEWEEHQKKILVAYENCIECGACRMLCPFENINCDWPDGGMGVKYKLG